MKSTGIFLVLALLSVAGIAGCVDVTEMDARIQLRLRESQDQNKKDLEKLASDITLAQQGLQKEFNTKYEIAINKIEENKFSQQKDSKEIHETLIDIQKDFFQNKRVTEDTARRVYILESLIAATRSAPEEKAEGEILYVRDEQVTTSLGSKGGVKAGDILLVYADGYSSQSIGKIQVIVAEPEKSSGEIQQKSGILARGNIVRLQK